MLAQNNVLDFDAASFIKGQKPRYVGNPQIIPPFIDGMPDASNLRQLEQDEYTPPNKNIVKNPSWKKWLFGALALGGLAFGGWKFKNRIVPWARNLWTNVSSRLNFTNIKQFVIDKAQMVGRFFKNCWLKVKGFFTRRP